MITVDAADYAMLFIIAAYADAAAFTPCLRALPLLFRITYFFWSPRAPTTGMVMLRRY